MPAIGRVPPGRAGALWLRRRLALAERGSDLLERKLAILLGEERRLRLRAAQTGGQWHDADAAARALLLRAAAVHGQRAVQYAVPPAAATLERRWTAVIGVRCPDRPVLDLPTAERTAAPAPATVDAARNAYRDALAAAARFAAAEAAHAAVTREAGAVRRRVRALQRHWIPGLHDALAAVEQQMAAQEAADLVRRRRAVAAKQGRTAVP